MHTYHKSSDPVTTIGLDIGKNTFHLGQSRAALPGISDLDLFNDLQSVVHLNAQVSHCALNFLVPEQTCFHRCAWGK